MKITTEFDYQWGNFNDRIFAFNRNRIKEFLELTKFPPDYFIGRLCVDAGCGSGRWTYAMQQLGAEVLPFDLSLEAVKRARRVNKSAKVMNIMDLKESHTADFVLCWGVLHHLENPLEGFKKVSGLVRPGGWLHIMVYNKEDQQQYEVDRKIWNTLEHMRKVMLCQDRAQQYGGTLSGWWDALNPKYNFSFTPSEIEQWFKDCGYGEILMTHEHNINMQGRYLGVRY